MKTNRFSVIQAVGARTAIAACAALLVSLLAVFSARAAEVVDVSIEVLAGSKTKAGFAGAAKRYEKQIRRLGYSGAEQVDTLTAKGREVGSQVVLEFVGPDQKKRKIRVKVLEASKAKVRLEISESSSKLNTVTTHNHGGTLFVVLDGQDLLLAVRPK